MAVAVMMVALIFFFGLLTLLINAVIAPDWLDWVQFACFTMLFPLSLHCGGTLTLFWIFTALAVIADAVSFYLVKKRGGKTGKHLLRLWLTPTVAFMIFIIAQITLAID